MIDDDATPFRLAAQAFKELGFELVHRKSTGGTDGNHYNGAGIQCVALSVGQQHEHSVEECLAIQDFFDAACAQLKILEIAGNEAQ